MNREQADIFIINYGKYFPNYQLPAIRERLLQMGDEATPYLTMLNLKDPTIILIVSILIGSFGIDRFMVGDTGFGIFKLITCGGFGIWTIIDWFLIMERAKEKNMESIAHILRSNQ